MRSLLTIALLAAAVAPASAATRAAMTIYNRDLAFVREQRSLDLRARGDTVRIGDIPDRIDISSVRLALPGRGRVSRLAYRFDVASGDRLLEVARGRRVIVLLRDRVVEGTLVNADGGWLMVRQDNGALETVQRTAVENIRFPRPPENLAVEPTLEAVVEGVAGDRAAAELAYLTGGLSWSAEHTLVRETEGTASWGSMVSIENVSGQEYEVPKLGLVAGEPSRAVPPPMPVMRQAMEVSMAGKVAGNGADMGEQEFGEYHLYTLDRPALLRDRETQRLVMLEDRSVKTTPRHLYRGGATGVALQLELTNTTANGLGVPLAAGRVRVYERDGSGEVRFTGEGRIKHTAEGEKLTIDVGKAFDLVAERRETYNKRISDREREYEVEIKLRNRKKTNVTITVEENVGSDFEVIRKSHELKRKDANTITFDVPVAAGKEVILTYAVRVRY
jgi:hypothetical protein